MRVFLAVPQFGRTEDAREREATFREQLEAELFGRQHEHVAILRLAPGERIDIGRAFWRDAATGEDRTTVTTVPLPDTVGKGTAIQLAAMHALDQVDKGRMRGSPDLQPLPRSAARFALVDGSGAFPAEAVPALLRALDDHEIVLGNRLDTNWTSTKERLVIEDFEQHLLHLSFPGAGVGNWPDCQAGIWGFSLALADRLHITVSDYGPELALACCVARAQLTPHFIPVATSPTRAESLFNPENALAKLRFLVQTLALRRAQLHAALDDYLVSDRARRPRTKYDLSPSCNLPGNYVARVRELPEALFRQGALT